MSGDTTPAIDVGNQKQLFIDNRFIAQADRVRLVMNTPVRDADPVLIADRPWEPQGITGFTTVMHDQGRFRVWYGAVMKSGLPQEGAIRLAYAESDDGLNWTKPDLGLIEFEGSKQNNLLAPLHEKQSMQSGTIFRDERAPADHRYRLWTKFRPSNDELEAGVRAGLWAMHSPDGLSWQYDDGQPNPPTLMCDTQNMFFWDDRIDQYVGYNRVRETQHADEAAISKRGVGSYRAIGRVTSPDFKNWSAQRIVFEADALDLAMPVPERHDAMKPVIDIYTSCAMKYPWAQDAYFMFPSIYHHWGEHDFPATMDIQLLTSRDGIAWQRCGDRAPFIRRGLDGQPDGGMIFANPWLIDRGDELWLYYTGRGDRHDGPKERTHASGLYRTRIRRDGFISLDAPVQGGRFQTPPLIFSGNRLELNYDGSAGGWLKVELRRPDGMPIDGFTFDDAVPVTDNAIVKQVTWRGSGDLADLAGQPIQLAFLMCDSKLYSFQFAS